LAFEGDPALDLCNLENPKQVTLHRDIAPQNIKSGMIVKYCDPHHSLKTTE